MKYFIRMLALIASLTTAAVASPLHKEQVAADAKWLVHVDVDKLRPTTLGNTLKQFLDSQMGALKSQFDIDLDWNKIGSITAYGSSYESMPHLNGVVLINTDLDLQKALDGAIEKMSAADSNAPPPIKKTKEGVVTTYSMPDTMFVAFESGKPVILGKSRDSVQKAGEVLSGKSTNLASTRTFSEFPDSPKPFFLVAAAEAFNLSKEFAERGEDKDDSNPKAKILKLTDGGRVMLGEEANQLVLELSLKAKTSEVVTQMQQVVQGIIALASLSQTDNPDLQRLAQSAKVSAAGKIVSLQVAYPADKAVQMLNSQMTGHTEHKKSADGGEGHRKKRKPKKDAETTEPTKTDEK